MKKRKKLGAERLSEFFRQFSVLVESGLSIPETLEIMQQDDTDREFCLACRKLGAFMTEGKTVGDAMEETGRFPEPAIQMIRAAEMSGQLVRTTRSRSLLIGGWMPVWRNSRRNSRRHLGSA